MLVNVLGKIFNPDYIVFVEDDLSYPGTQCRVDFNEWGCLRIDCTAEEFHELLREAIAKEELPMCVAKVL